MKTISKILGLGALICIALAGTSFLLKPDYSKSSVAFKIKNAGIGVNGSFKTFEVAIDFNESMNAPSSIKATIKVGTIDTGIEARDNHLRKEDFFNVAAFPTMTFESTQIQKTTSGSLIAEGKLTIKGVTKDIRIPFTYSNGVFEGAVTLNRLDYGVGGNSVTMSNEVDVALKVTATK